MRVPVWNSFGGRIAPLDTFQHVVPGGITFLTKIYTSHAAGVCRPLSLFLLSLHDVVIICNMRNAESCSLRLALQVGCAGHASALGWRWRVEHRFGH